MCSVQRPQHSRLVRTLFFAASAGGLASRGSESCAVPVRRASTRDVFSRDHASTLTGTEVSFQISIPGVRQSMTRCRAPPGALRCNGVGSPCVAVGRLHEGVGQKCSIPGTRYLVVAVVAAVWIEAQESNVDVHHTVDPGSWKVSIRSSSARVFYSSINS